jgi:hypothetical protein
MHRQSQRVLLLLVGLAMIVLRSSAAACSCVGETDPKTAVRQSNAVFSGRAVDERVLTPNNPDPELREREITFEVTSIWKGDLRRRVRVRTAIDNAMCGYDFRRGITYLVYAWSERGGLRTNNCSRTTPSDQARGDLRVLGPSKTPR